MVQCVVGTQHLPPGDWVEWTAEEKREKVPPTAPGSALEGRGRPSDDRSGSMYVLVVDDEQIIADTLATILTLSGFHATAAYSGDEALASIDSHCPDVVLTDVRMPGRSGIETGILIRQQCPHLRVVLFSGQAGIADMIEQVKQDGYGFELWSKPLHPRELVRRLRTL